MGAIGQDVHWQSRDGLRLYARDHLPAQARGLPLVCVHGLTRNAADFDRFAAWAAQRGRRVLAVDLRGRGRSQRASRPASYNVSVYARDVLGLMDAQGIPRAVFVGTSLGALVTMTLAAQRPAAVAAAVLNDAGPEVAPAALARIRAYAGQAPAPMSLAETVDYTRRIAGVAHPHYTDSDWQEMASRLFRQRDDGRYEPDYDPRVVRTAGPLLLRLLRPLLWRAFRKLCAGRPTLLLHGELSDVLDAPLIARIRQVAPTLTVVDVPGVGHAPDLSEPAALAAIAALLEAAG